MKMHVVTGLPRAGSTLLCNILNQNPRFWANSTSPLPNFLSSIINIWSNSIETKNLLEKDRINTETKMQNCLTSFAQNWLYQPEKEIFFDKSRGWTHHYFLLKRIFPDAKMVVLIRDLRSVFASIEKQHRKTPLFDDTQDPVQKGIFQRADQMFSPNGIIGHCLEGIMDLIRRDTKDVLFIPYEGLSKNPKFTMEKIYEEIGEPSFKHDFDNITNTAIDCDGHYLYKFPHEGSGKVTAVKADDWKEYIPNDLATTIMQRFNEYNKFFSYI